MKTIKQLRQTGYKVRVMHKRDTIPVHTMNGIVDFLNAKGGSTRIELTTPDKTQNVVGESFCSKKDRFDRRVGNQLALSRALEKLNKFDN